MSAINVNSITGRTGTHGPVLTGVTTVTGGTLNTAALNVTGAASFSGNVSIAGTLSYDDVTDIDSVGVITARSGINVTGGQLNVGSNIKIGNAGVITATSFSGSIPAGQITGTIADARLSTVSSSKLSGALPALDGSALTGIAGTANVRTNTLNVIGVSTFTGAINSNSNVTTTLDLNSRYLYAKDIFLEDVSPELRFTDSDENPDYRIRLNAGLLGIRDITNNVDKMVFSTAGVNIPVSNVGVQTNFPTSSTLVGAASSLIGMYIGDGHMLFSDNLSRSGGYYIPNGLNALNAGPVTLNSTMTLDGVWVIV